MARSTALRLMGAVCLLVTVAAPTLGDGLSDRRRILFSAGDGSQEVPAVNTPGEALTVFKLKSTAEFIRYELEYRGLRGRVVQAHLHYGQRGVNGGVLAFLCATPQAGGSSEAPPCGEHGVEGEINADSVLGIEGQGVDPGDFDALLRILRSGDAYVNVHTDRFPAGEVRGQVGKGTPSISGGDDDD